MKADHPAIACLDPPCSLGKHHSRLSLDQLDDSGEPVPTRTTQVGPGAKAIGAPAALVSVVPAAALARAQVPSTRLPSRNTLTWPEPMVCVYCDALPFTSMSCRYGVIWQNWTMTLAAL